LTISKLIEPDDLRFMKNYFLGIGGYKTGTCDPKVMSPSPVNSMFKAKRHCKSAFFIAGVGLEPTTSGL